LTEGCNLILGAGLAGLSAAYALQRAGEDGWVVLEKEMRPGGHARSHEIDGYTFDYGPHILFTNDREMEALIRDLLGDNLRAQERQAFIYHHAYDLYTRFPFQAHLFGLPPALVKECLAGLVQAVELQARGEFAPRNYEEWMRGFFGDGIAEHLMIPYARKLWTVEPSTMDFNWIGRRVPTPEVDRILIGALTDDVEQIGATAHFWYPWHGGIEALPRALAKRVDGIQFGRDVQRIDPERRIVELAGGDTIAYGELIFTLPLASLPRLIPDLPPHVATGCAQLRSQGILSINLGVDRPTLSPYHWV
jgi:protoporphyrinogen oxidase